MDVTVYNMQGEQSGSLTVDEKALSASLMNDGINPQLIKQAYVMYHANLRQGSARNRNRAMMSYSRKKLGKQKGGGRARHGDRRVHIMRGGGVAFNKTRTREDYHQTMPKKMRRKANRNALLAKLVDNEVRVIDGLSMDSPKTSTITAMMGKLGMDRKALMVLSNDPEKRDVVKNIALSSRNIDDVTVIPLDELTAFTMLNHRYLIIGKDELVAWLEGPSSQTGKSARTEPMGRSEKREKRPGAPRGKKVREGAASGGDA